MFLKRYIFSWQISTLIFLPVFNSAIFFASTLVILPFYLARNFVVVPLAKLVDPGIIRIVTGLSASLLRDHDKHSTKPLSTIVVCLKCRGSLTFEQFEEQFEHRILLKRKENERFIGGALQFPELQQHFKSFLGYVFLRWDSTFKITNHVKPLREKGDPKKPVVLSKREISKIREELMIKPFKSGQSPWEILFLENFQDEEDENPSGDKRFIFFLRVHHAIADGFSVQKMLTYLDPTYSSTTLESSPEVNFLKRPSVQNVLMNVNTLIFGPYQLLERLLKYREPYHELHLPVNDLSKEYFVVDSPLVMEVKDVKKIKNKVGVAFTTALLGIVAGGIRRYLEGNQKQIPQFHCLGIPFVTGNGDKDKLGNDFLIAPLNLPVHRDCPLERLHDIQGQFESLRYSTIPKMLNLSIDLLSCLPISLMRALTKKSVFSTAYSSLPGPVKPVTYLDSRLEEIGFTYGTGAASLGLGFSSITYLDKLRITLFIDKNLIDGKFEKAEEIIACLNEEYEELCKMAGIF